MSPFPTLPGECFSLPRECIRHKGSSRAALQYGLFPTYIDSSRATLPNRKYLPHMDSSRESLHMGVFPTYGHQEGTTVLGSREQRGIVHCPCPGSHDPAQESASAKVRGPLAKQVGSCGALPGPLGTRLDQGGSQGSVPDPDKLS